MYQCVHLYVHVYSYTVGQRYKYTGLPVQKSVFWLICIGIHAIMYALVQDYQLIGEHVSICIRIFLSVHKHRCFSVQVQSVSCMHDHSLYVYLRTGICKTNVRVRV